MSSDLLTQERPYIKRRKAEASCTEPLRPNGLFFPEHVSY